MPKAYRDSCLTEVLLCVVAVDGGCLGKVGNGAGLGGLAGAISANGIAKDAGGPDGAAVFVGRCHIHRLRQDFGCNAGERYYNLLPFAGSRISSRHTDRVCLLRELTG